MAEARGWAVVKVSPGKEDATFLVLSKFTFPKRTDWWINKIHMIEPSVKEKGGLVVAAFVALTAQDMTVLSKAIEEIRKKLPVSQAPDVQFYPVGRSFGPNWGPLP